MDTSRHQGMSIHTKKTSGETVHHQNGKTALTSGIQSANFNNERTLGIRPIT